MLSTNKTKAMFIGRADNIFFDGEEVEQIQKYKYLGSRKLLTVTVQKMSKHE